VFITIFLWKNLVVVESMGKPLKISEQAAVQMPMKTVASLISLVAIGTWAFFGIQENLNRHATKLQIMEEETHLYSVAENVRLLSKKKDRREKC
jgi:hypothetical protein